MLLQCMLLVASSCVHVFVPCMRKALTLSSTGSSESNSRTTAMAENASIVISFHDLGAKCQCIDSKVLLHNVQKLMHCLTLSAVFLAQATHKLLPLQMSALIHTDTSKRKISTHNRNTQTQHTDKSIKLTSYLARMVFSDTAFSWSCFFCAKSIQNSSSEST